MTGERIASDLSEFLRYLAIDNNDGERLPALPVLSQQLGVSTARLREQLEVARSLGLVEVRPKTGIRRLSYRFTPAVLSSLCYASTIDPSYFFSAYSDFRNHVEFAYWKQAVGLLNQEDYWQLNRLVKTAFDKLNGQPIQIPHGEHRELHLIVYRRLENPFVIGVLEAYWEVYEALGLNLYADISYLRRVWDYHKLMVDAICSGEIDVGYHALIDHTDLLLERSRSISRLNFE